MLIFTEGWSLSNDYWFSIFCLFVLETLPTEQRSCAITPDFQDSPFIRAFMEKTEDGHGCFSNQTINGMEVHVIYLDNHLKHNVDVYLEIIANSKGLLIYFLLSKLFFF